MRRKTQLVINWLHKRRSSIAWIVLGIAVAGAISISAAHIAKQAAFTNYRSEIASCQRGNRTRHLIDTNITASVNTQVTLRALLNDAATAREANYAATHLKSDRLAALRYNSLYTLEGDVNYRYLPIINCRKVIEKP